MVIMPQRIGDSELTDKANTADLHFSCPSKFLFPILLANLGVLYFSLAMSVSGYKGNY